MLANKLINSGVSLPDFAWEVLNEHTHATNYDTFRKGSMVLLGKYLFAMFSQDGYFRAFDVEDPTNITLAGSLLTAGDYCAVLDDDHIVITDSSADRIRTINVADVTAMSIVDTLIDATNLDGASRVICSGNYAFTVTVGTIAVVDCTDRSNIAYNNSCTRYNSHDDLLIEGDYLYAVQSYYVYNYDISTPTAIAQNNSLYNLSLYGASSIGIGGNYLFAACDNNNRVCVINKTNPSAMSYLNKYEDANIGTPQCLQMIDDYGVLVGSYDGLVLLEHSSASPGTLTEVAFMADTDLNFGDVNGMCYNGPGGILFCGDTIGDALRSVSITWPSHSQWITLDYINSSSVYHDNPRQVIANDEIVIWNEYDDDAISIADATKSTFVYKGTYASSTYLDAVDDDLCWVNDNLIMAAGIFSTKDRLTLVDVSIPTAPALKGSLVDATYLGAPFKGLCASVDEQYAYVYAQGYFTVVDISVPTTPVRSGSCSATSGVSCIAASGTDKVIAPSDGTGYNIGFFDVSNPAAPVAYAGLLSDINKTQGVSRLIMQGDIGFMSADANGLLTIADFSNISVGGGSVISTFALSGIQDICMPNPSLVVAHQGTKLSVIDVGDLANPKLLDEIVTQYTNYSTSKMACNRDRVFVTGPTVNRLSAFSLDYPISDGL